MKVVATNTGEKRTVLWREQPVTTGIFKFPVEEGIVLGTEDVEKDHVIDRRYHGGLDKACYAYSADHYAYWKTQFPQLDWNYGMFGENLTIEGFDEKRISIGDVFKIGEAIVQVSEPRQPCMKLNVRFNSSQAVKAFNKFGRSGTYFRVIQTGRVQPGDAMELIEQGKPFLSLFDLYQLIVTPGNEPLRDVAKQHPQLAKTTIADL